MRRAVIILICTVFALSTTVMTTCGKSRATVSIEKKLSSSKKKAEVLKLLLSTFLASGDLENALKVTTIATALFPQDPYWWEKHAEVNTWTGRPDEALRAYIKAYRLSGREETRKKAIELAIALNRFDIAKGFVEKDVEAGRVDELKNVVRIYEQAGSIDELIPLLQKLYKREGGKEVLKALSRLYFFYGSPSDAIKSLEEMEQRYGLTSEEALFYARLLYTLKRYRQALSVLKRHSEVASPEDTEFWETMSDIAWGIKDYPTAVQASETLHKVDRARQVDYERLFLWWAEKKEEKAIQYALKGWHKFRIDYMFYYFLNAAASVRAWRLITDEIERLDREDLERFMKNPSFVSIYAQALAKEGRFSEARRLYGGLLEKEFSKEALASYIYFLLDIDDSVGLKRVVKRYSELEKESELTTPFIFAYVRLQDGRKALELSSLLPRNTVDRELLYSDVLYLYGREYEAEALRYSLYKRLKRSLDENPQLIRDRTFIENFLRVAIYYEPPERIKRYFHHAKRILPRQMVEDIELSYLLWIGEQDRAKYLIKRYGYMARPWMYLNLALWEDERMKMLELLETSTDILPVRDRVEALVRTGRIKDALGYAYSGLDDNREDALLYTQYTGLVAEYEQSTALELDYIMYGPYEEFKEELSLGTYISKGISLELSAITTQKIRNDTDNLVNPPSGRRRLAMEITGLLDRGKVGLTLGTMKGLKRNTFYRLWLETYYLANRLSLALSYGKNLFTDDNVYLYLGGMRESYTATLFYNHSYKTSLSLELGSHRYSSQDDIELGTGTTIRQTLFYRVRTGYPDYTFRVYLESLGFNEDRESGAIIERLYPVAPARVLNKSYNLVGAGLFFGQRHREGYTRVWRPFMNVDVTWNNRTDIGFDVGGGIGGGLFRQDNLSLGFRYVKGFKAREDKYLKVFLAYRLFY